MYDVKGIILKQKKCRWHMTTIKSLVVFQDLSLLKYSYVDASLNYGSFISFDII